MEGRCPWSSDGREAREGAGEQRRRQSIGGEARGSCWQGTGREVVAAGHVRPCEGGWERIGFDLFSFT
jgi:hypothetical protein